jgi:hypothetical protein
MKLKQVLLILLVLIVAFAGYIWFVYFKGGKKTPKGPEAIPLAVSKHSASFNQSVQSALTAYYTMSEAFVNWDTLSVNKNAGDLKNALDNLKIDELKVDSNGIYESVLDPITNAKSLTETILSDPSIEKKRIAFNDLSENLRLLFIIVKYDANKLYWQECPMAFGEGRPGNWLSQTDAVRNPYLGTKDPQYKDAMLHCGGPKDTINFMAPDTTGK